MRAVLPTTRLARRGLLRIRGKDSVNFMHAMTTNNFNEADPSELMYSAFLTSKGRVLYDGLAHQSVNAALGVPEFHIEMDRHHIAHAVTHLREYKMRKKVEFADVSDELAIIVSQSDNLNNNAKLDPRPPLNFGQLRRWLLPTAEAVAAHPTPGDEAYNELLYSEGVGEGPAAFEMDKSLPFDGNLDLLDGVSFEKGCYVGQELTHRTHVMLVTRKRLMPLTVVGGAAFPAALPLPAPLIAADGSSAGRVTAWQGQHGVGLVRLAHVDPTPGAPATVLRVKGAEGLSVQATVPAWWPVDYVFEKLREPASDEQA